MIRLQGYIQDYDGEVLTAVALLSSAEQLLAKQQVNECEIAIRDGREISATQRKHIYATMRDISDWCGHLPEEAKQILKYEFIARYGGDEFSLSDCDMTTARVFLTFLLSFCVEHGVPCKEGLLSRCEDIQAYLYACVVNVKCAVCGKKADIHEVDTVGMGRRREEIAHVGQRVQPLCRLHHGECHTIGQQTFDQKYHLENIVLDEFLYGILHGRLGWKE